MVILTPADVSVGEAGGAGLLDEADGLALAATGASPAVLEVSMT